MNRRIAVVALLALGLLTAAAPSAFAADEAQALKHASDRGRLIYAFDQAAWISTDEMMRQLPDPKAAGVAGYVVEPVEGGLLRAIYYRLDAAGAPHAVFTADVRGRTVTASRLYPASDAAPLSPLAQRMIKALDAASADAVRRKLAPCAPEPFNPVVLPPDMPNGPTPVYLLTPQTKEGEYPFGGHYEIDVSADGAVVGSRAFTRSCLTLSTTPPPDGKTVEMSVTHLLDPAPTEIHVYLSLWIGVPVIVSTGDPARIWRVDGERISLARDQPAPR